MLETRSSPLSEVTTASGADLPSDPGAPPGQRGISAAIPAAGEKRHMLTSRLMAMFIDTLQDLRRGPMNHSRFEALTAPFRENSVGPHDLDSSGAGDIIRPPAAPA